MKSEFGGNEDTTTREARTGVDIYLKFENLKPIETKFEDNQDNNVIGIK